MGGRKIRPARVYNSVVRELRCELMPGHRAPEPAWFRILHSVPPAEAIVRTLAPRHRNTGKQQKLYKPQRIVFPEDALRKTFYKDHPWELARPRVMLESDGKDYQLCDWSRGLQQPGMALSGECVVQHQMWLMQNEKLSKQQAYDKARYELYKLRHREEVTARIAVEEARHVGAYFGLTKLDVGMLLEEREFEKWKVWAKKETEMRESRDQGQMDSADAGDETDAESLSKLLDDEVAKEQM